jgi:hypothetical protein
MPWPRVVYVPSLEPEDKIRALAPVWRELRDVLRSLRGTDRWRAGRMHLQLLPVPHLWARLRRTPAKRSSEPVRT